MERPCAPTSSRAGGRTPGSSRTCSRRIAWRWRTGPPRSTAGSSWPEPRVQLRGTGGAGMLGQDLRPLLAAAGHEVRAPRHADVPLEGKGALETWLGGWTPERVFHLAAFTDVDGCEKDEPRA